MRRNAMRAITVDGTTHAVSSASTRAGSDASRIVALALLSVRFIQGFIYWGGGVHLHRVVDRLDVDVRLAGRYVH
jgi:hypothetical protein